MQSIYKNSRKLKAQRLSIARKQHINEGSINQAKTYVKTVLNLDPESFLGKYEGRDTFCLVILSDPTKDTFYKFSVDYVSQKIRRIV